MDPRIDEFELLAWIEEELPPERLRAVEAALAADPALISWARAARHDRALLRAVTAADAAQTPAGLIEDALAAAERGALLGVPTPNPRSAQHRPFFTPRRLALAACLAIGAGLIALYPLIARQSGFQGTQSGPSRVASAPDPSESRREASLDEFKKEAPSRADDGPAAITATPADQLKDTSAQLASGATGVERPGGPAVSDAASLTGVVPVTAKADEAVGRLAESNQRALSTSAAPREAEGERRAARPPASLSSDVPVALRDISPEEAARLARQGRLAIVASTADPALLASRLADSDDPTKSPIVWTSLDPTQIPAPLLRLLPRDAADGAMISPPPGAIETDSSPARQAGPTQGAPAAEHAAAPIICVADMAATPAAMAQLRNALQPETGVRFVELEQPLARFGRGRSAESLLQWAPLSPARPSASVPVLIVRVGPGSPAPR